MKTVWHWKNIGKASLMVILMVILVGIIVSLLQLPDTIGFLVGMAAGYGAMLFSLIKWDLWHFE